MLKVKYLLIIVLFVVAVALVMPQPNVTLAQGSGKVPLRIRGPEEVGQVNLRLERIEDEPGGPSFAPRSWNTSPGEYELDLFSMPDGYYQLSLNTNSGFFRKPQGYFFGVSNGQLIASPSREGALDFEMVSPADAKLPPCRIIGGPPTDSGMSVRANTDREICQAEYYVDLSAPPRPPRQTHVGTSSLTGFADENLLQDGLEYKYAGIVTNRASDGVQATLNVVNTETPHYWTLGDHWVEHVYAKMQNNLWMEAGWAEVSWNPDIQYLYEYDAVNYEWRFFPQYSLSPGSYINVKVYNSSSTRWTAAYDTGAGWAVLGDEDLAFGSTYTYLSYLSGERYSKTYYDPYVPRSWIYNGQLLINGLWTAWTSSTVTWQEDYPPYYSIIYIHYTNFNVGS